MMKMLNVVFVVVALSFSFSTCAEEHEGGGEKGRTKQGDVAPSEDSSSKLLKAINACMDGRPGPSVEVPPLSSHDSTKAEKSVTGGTPEVGGDSDRGASVFQANCIKCHTEAEIKAVSAAVQERLDSTDEEKKMPKGKPSLSAEDKAALLAWLAK